MIIIKNRYKSIAKAGVIIDFDRIRTGPGKPGKSWGRFLKGGINYTRYNSYSRDKSAILGITIPGIKMGSQKHCLSLE